MVIDLHYFLIGLSLGVFYVYLSHDPHVIMLYPNDKKQYRKEGECHSYTLKEVTCPM